MDKHDEQLENFLREFEPRPPRALPMTLAPRRDWRRLAAAAVVTIVVGTSAWFVWRKPGGPAAGTAAMRTTAPTQGEYLHPPLSVLPLTRMALEDSARLDATLAEASRHELPDFRGAQSTLHVLAKE